MPAMSPTGGRLRLWAGPARGGGRWGCSPATRNQGPGGKAVTIVSGVPLAPDALKALAKTLKQKCGVGGAVKNTEIEIQGDQRAVLKPTLEKLGYTVKLAGG